MGPSRRFDFLLFLPGTLEMPKDNCAARGLVPRREALT
jgi:hypothetical protein